MSKEELERAFEEYERWYGRRKNEICTRLLTIRNNCPDKTYSEWLLDAINFIQEDKR